MEDSGTAGRTFLCRAPASLACDKDKGIRVRPEHIHTALREYAGIAVHPMSKQFPLVIPEKERLQGLWG